MNLNLTHWSSARTLSALLVAIIMTTATAACTGSDDDVTDVSTDETSDTSETSDVTTETTEVTDTTAPEPTETTESNGTTASTSTSGTSNEGGAPVPDGSGCTPGDDETLPDGRWFGYASSREADSFTFDLACWFTGDDAVAAASEDGAESPPPNDYHIRNDNPAERLLIPAPDATVEFLAEPGDPSTVETIDYPTWMSVATDRSFEPGVWVEISDGMVVAIEEQYQP